MIYVVLFQLTIFSIKIKNPPWVDKTRGKGGYRVEEYKDEKRERPDLASLRMDDWCWCLFRRQIWDASRLVWEKSWEKTSKVEEVISSQVLSFPSNFFPNLFESVIFFRSVRNLPFFFKKKISFMYHCWRKYKFYGWLWDWFWMPCSCGFYSQELSFNGVPIIVCS